MCWVFQLCKCCSTISLVTRRPLSRASAALAGATHGFTHFFMDFCAMLCLGCSRFVRPQGSFPFRILNTALRKSLALCWDWIGHSGDKSLCLAGSSALGFFLSWQTQTWFLHHFYPCFAFSYFVFYFSVLQTTKDLIYQASGRKI